MPRKSPFLTIKEKRKLMADIVRDKSGNYTMNEKFKAVVEDTKLEEIDLERNPPEPPPPPIDAEKPWEILRHLPAPLAASTPLPLRAARRREDDEEEEEA